MIKNYQKNIPDGMRDMVYGEIKTVKALGEQLLGLYQNRGFAEVKTPAVEYFDVFNIRDRVLAEETMFKFTDKGGRLAVLRPDNTTPMARIASTRLKNAPRPVKLCYQQNVFRIADGYSGKRNEFTQTGIEIMGGDRIKTDLECVTLAFRSLAQISEFFGGIPYKLEIGHAGFALALVDSLSLDENEKALAFDYMEAKNSGAIEFLSGGRENIDRAIALLRKIPRLFGGKDVLEKARELCEDVPKAGMALDELADFYSILEMNGLSDNVTIDLSISHEMDYYTGLVFRGYVDGAGEVILGGGRYDTLLDNFGEHTPATGFGINISVLADKLSDLTDDNQKRVECLVSYDVENLSAALAYADECGKVCEFSSFDSMDDTLLYASAKKIPMVVHICNDNVVKITKL